jgi:hypothetical protein
MPNTSETDVLASRNGTEIPSVSINFRDNRGPEAHRWFSEAMTKHNLTLLAMISAFLAGVDTVQSFYLQRVVNQFNEANLLPLKFYNNGVIGYLLYTPIDFLALYTSLLVLWIWASYLIWYYKQFISPVLRLNA